MAKRKFYRARRRLTKRRRRRRRSGSNFLRTIGPGLTHATPIGKKFVLRTRYVANAQSVNPGTGGTSATLVYSLNGLYDPEITATGHQPLGFDQFIGTLYNHYTVVGARVRVTAHNNDTAVGQILLLQIKDTATTSADIEDMIENSLNRYTVLAPEGSGGSCKTMSINFSAKKFFSVGKGALVGNDLYRGDSASNPQEQAYLHVTGKPLSGTDTADIRFIIDIQYIAVLTEPRQLTGS